MNKPLVLSLAAAAVLTSNVNAQSMLERFEAMESEMSQLKEELATFKSQKVSLEEEDETLDSEDEESGEDAEDEESDEDAEEDEEEMDIEEEIADIHESISELNKSTSGNHLKFSIDYRFALENLSYKMADGSTAKNDAFMTNRLWMNMAWAATKTLSFTGQLAYNKAFGQRSGVNPATAPFETFDWIANENAYDDSLRVRSAYFFYKNKTFLGTDVPWTFSVGRRPSTNGHLINLRDDDKSASPMGHAINVEFDGLSSKFSFDKWAQGMYVKLCAGRGMSNAAPKFDMMNGAPYAENSNVNPNIDLIGLIFTPYNDRQYSVSTQYYYANNLIDANFGTGGIDTVGGMHSVTANVVANGIGDEWSNFLDDTTIFASAAMSVTDPKEDEGMLGAPVGESRKGYSYWIGTQFPSLISDDGRWGLEYNRGSKYWRSITYGEDTNIGSKVATRGNAYEAYFTEYLVEDILSLQLRYTYLDYKFTGSNGFFGNTTGASTLISNSGASNVVDTAQDIRFYLRYKY